MRNVLTKSHRLRKKSQYQAVFKEKNRLATSSLLIHYRHNPENTIPKLGLSVSCRFGKSHDRNLFKRRIKEIFRLIQNEIPSTLEINISPRIPSENPSYDELKKELRTMISSIDQHEAK